jgi:hypothetical protein
MAKDKEKSMYMHQVGHSRKYPAHVIGVFLASPEVLIANGYIRPAGEILFAKVQTIMAFDNSQTHRPIRKGSWIRKG